MIYFTCDRSFKHGRQQWERIVCKFRTGGRHACIAQFIVVARRLLIKDGRVINRRVRGSSMVRAGPAGWWIRSSLSDAEIAQHRAFCSALCTSFVACRLLADWSTVSSHVGRRRPGRLRWLGDRPRRREGHYGPAPVGDGRRRGCSRRRAKVLPSRFSCVSAVASTR